MSELMSQIGTFLGSGPGKAAETGAVAGGGLLQNWLANREAQKKQKFVEDLITHPDKFSSYVKSFERPLSAGLTTDVARQTDAYGAERGLGSSPAIMKDVLAQALAPYYLQQQQMAQQRALEGLGIYEQSPTTKPVDITSLLKILPGLRGGGGDFSAGADLSGAPSALETNFPLPSPSLDVTSVPTLLEGSMG